MSTLGNHLVDDLLEVAADLAGMRAARATLQDARRRRAVSSAYYALFHALSSICTDALVGWESGDDVVDLVYRTLDHAATKTRLASRQIADVDPTLAEVGIAFARLQDKRHAADYGPPTHAIGFAETAELIEQSRAAIQALERLDGTKRLKLAAHLVARQRSQPRP